MKHLLLISLFSLVLYSCGGTTFVNTATLPDTYQCSYMKDICKEAREFEITFNNLSPDEKKEVENVLKAYRLQCSEAIELCKKYASELDTQKK